MSLRHSALATAMLASLAAACAGGPSPGRPALGGDGGHRAPRPSAAQTAATGDTTRGATGGTAETSRSPYDPATVGANELGLVPVLMYHRIVPDPSGVYERTPEQFRAELERLAQEDYVPVTAGAYASGQMDIPGGTHPVVLTFDDATHDQVAFDASGQPEEDTALATLLSVADAYPDFRPVATFFVTRDPFALPDGEPALSWLHEHGFEIGNHTYTHADLGELSAGEVQREVAKVHRMVNAAAPGADITTAALPMGISPENEELAAHGSWEDVDYVYDGVFLVGARPAPSPHAADFDPLAIPRIRSQGADGPDAKWSSAHWLDHLEAHPDERYTSDGDPARISFPAESADQLGDDLQQRANPY